MILNYRYLVWWYWTIIEQFHLKDLPQKRGGRFYRDTAAYGHFGRTDLKLPWEEVSQHAAELQEIIKDRLRK